jgi:hypothetical protein
LATPKIPPGRFRSSLFSANHLSGFDQNHPVPAFGPGTYENGLITFSSFTLLLPRAAQQQWIARFLPK